MTERLRNAATNTNRILAYAEGATATLRDRQPRKNAAGVLVDPSQMIADLRMARGLIDDAILICNATAWPHQSDYHDL